MTAEFISKRTRNAFREFLVQSTLHEIGMDFEDGQVLCDIAYEPPDVSGQRRTLVERHYHTLDMANPSDVRRLIAVYEAVLRRAERLLTLPSSVLNRTEPVEWLKEYLARDGFSYADGTMSATTQRAREVMQCRDAVRTVTEVTRRAIFDDLRASPLRWSGTLSEVDFLRRVFDLSTLRSRSGQGVEFEAEVWQNREFLKNWNADWVFGDDRLNLLGCADKVLFRFLSEMVHPFVRQNVADARTLARLCNGHLAADGWQLVNGPAISGKPTFVARRTASARVALPTDSTAGDVLSEEYVRELSEKCDSRLADGDFEGAITVGRTFLEVILAELELRLTGAKGDHGGDLPKQFKQVARVLRLDTERPELDARFKDVIRGLVMVTSGLAPLRNKLSDGHARAKKPARHHAHLVVHAARTVAIFLVESYRFQRDGGLVQDAPSEEAGSA